VLTISHVYLAQIPPGGEGTIRSWLGAADSWAARVVSMV
jgi:hypothetical protein